MNKTTIISNGQTLADIAVQEQGSVEAIFDIAVLNGLESITTNLITGQVLILPSVPSIKAIADYFRNKNIRVNTGTTPTQLVPVSIFDNTFDDTFE
jgi:LysM repeat protein